MVVVSRSVQPSVLNVSLIVASSDYCPSLAAGLASKTRGRRGTGAPGPTLRSTFRFNLERYDSASAGSLAGCGALPVAMSIISSRYNDNEVRLESLY